MRDIDDIRSEISAEDAMRFLCKLSGYKKTESEIHKSLYISQMLYLGRTGTPLFSQDFEAWEEGPVCISVCKSILCSGLRGGRITKKYCESLKEYNISSSIESFLKEVHDITMNYKPHQITNIVHWENGAWAKYYNDRDGITIIPKNDILQEFKDRLFVAKVSD